MPIGEVTEWMVNAFSDNLVQLFQQQGSKLRRTTRERSVTGAADFWERIGKVAAVKKTVRHGDTPQIDTPHSRRMALPADWEWADLLDPQDVYRVLTDPRSEYVKAAVMALGRSFDQAIISGFDADARAGNDGAITVTFISEAAGDHDFSIQPLSVGNVVTIKGDLDNHDVPNTRRHIVLPPCGFSQLLKQSSVPNLTSVDYADVKALVKGKIDEYVGFIWHKSTLLPRPAANLRYGYAWHEDAMGVSISQDITTEVSERADKSYSMQVKASGSFAAVRIQGEGVVRFSIDETK